MSEVSKSPLLLVGKLAKCWHKEGRTVTTTSDVCSRAIASPLLSHPLQPDQAIVAPGTPMIMENDCLEKELTKSTENDRPADRGHRFEMSFQTIRYSFRSRLGSKYTLLCTLI